MNHKTFIFVLLLLVITTSQAVAQPSFSLPSVSNAQPNQIVELPMVVTGFQNITSAQFALIWNPAVLEYQTISDITLDPCTVDNNFNFQPSIDNSILRFAWTSPTFAGVTLPDNTPIYKIKMKVIGNLLQGSSFVFADTFPTAIEVQDSSGATFNQFQLNLTSGFVAVGYTLSAVSPSIFSSSPLVSPNPFSDAFNLSFELKQEDNIRFSILDGQGQLLYEKNEHFTTGTNGIEFASNIFNTSNIYFLLIHTSRGSIMKKILHIN